ncbi:hypothetical protein I4U23_023758 [Adineta vaga]|nr:hypothetical protein I4U23_023758 [Adineta vaga]
MVDIFKLLIIIEIICLLAIIIFAWIYILTILLVKRFHTAANILTSNICLAGATSASFWIAYFIILGFYPILLSNQAVLCLLLRYFQTVCSCLTTYALLTTTISRFFAVVYPNKRLFQRHTWSIISAITQWILAFTLPSPNFAVITQGCYDYSLVPFWLRFYTLFIIFILPSILIGVFNALIFFNVASSTRRVQALSTTTSNHANSNHQHARDMHLLKHIIFIFIVFIVGWGPIYTLSVIAPDSNRYYTLYLVLQLLPALSSLIVILDLFMYNRDLRHYLKQKIMKYLLL